MIRRLLLCTIIPITLLCACERPQPLARDGVFDLRGNAHLLTDAVVRLDGQWEFFWGTFLFSDPATTPAPTPPLAPLLVPVPDHWSNYTVDGERLPRLGYATFRLKLLLDAPMDNMVFRVREAAMSYRLYLNGELIVTEGEPGKSESETIAAANRAVSGPVRLERENEIVVEVANFHFFEGGVRKGVWIGTYDTIMSRRLWGQRLTIFLVGALFFMALYHLLLFGLERREKGALAFAIMCIGIMIRISLVNERVMLDLLPGIDYIPFLRVLMFCTYMVLPACTFYLGLLFPEYISRKLVVISTLSLIITTPFILFTSPVIFMHTLFVFTIMVIVCGAYGMYQLTRAIRDGAPDSGIFFVAFNAFLLSSINDTLYAQHVIQTAYYGGYGFSAFVFAQAFTVSRRILKSRQLSETLAADLERSNEQLRSVDRLKDEFLASTSHELRTPLQGIIGIADSMREESPRERRLNLIVSSGRRLAALVNDILDFSKLRYRDIQLQFASINLRAFADLQLELIAYHLQGKAGPELRNDVAPNHFVMADEARLTQIFQNLLGNAVKHTASGEIRVRARHAENSPTVIIEIQDTGTGIAPDQLDRIFVPFEQASNEERNRGGIGLGLPIAKSLAELHGGTLTVTSTLGHGSTFRFTLPRALGDEHTQHAEATPRPPLPLPRVERIALPTPEEPAADDSRDPLVLIVDDEPVNVEVMRAFLKTAALRLVSAHSAMRAREIIANGTLPDCLVLDIMMPKVSGLEYLRELRETYSQIELPVLMVTAMSRTNDLLAALDAGASDYLTKPFEKEEFKLRVTNLTALSRSHRDSRHAVVEATRRERERMNADLHDHLGGSLIDLQLMSEQALEEPGREREIMTRMHEKISDVIQILRNEMLGLEDLDLLEENFLEGMQLILLRRYVEAGRELDYQVENVSPGTIRPEYDQTLYSVLTEVANNDFKYGTGPAGLRIREQSGALVIVFESRSHYSLEAHGTGRGTAGMIRRLSQIGGTLQIAMGPRDESRNRPLKITIMVPL